MSERELGLITFSAATVIQAEGGRVGIVICNTCGAAILLDMDEDRMAAHIDWHERTDT